jgi:hypothetical protein
LSAHALRSYTVEEEAKPNEKTPITRGRRSRSPAAAEDPNLPPLPAGNPPNLGGYHGWIAASIAFPSRIAADPGSGHHETAGGKALRDREPVETMRLLELSHACS